MKSVSVPIELLERITRPQLKPRDETVRRRAITELRALLDKEVDGDSHAPKKQGEPVAELQVAFFEHGPMATINWFTPSEFESGATKLYAEQPAPVAVDAEILERFPEINFANYGQDEVEAMQAWGFEAYEAIARLNGVKP